MHDRVPLHLQDRVLQMHDRVPLHLQDRVLQRHDRVPLHLQDRVLRMQGRVLSSSTFRIEFEKFTGFINSHFN